MVENEFRTIDRYETIELLGRGGMGSVYLARDPSIDRYVAVKVLDAAFDATARQRFTREARASGRLHHPNIVTIFDVGEHQGRPFIAMEYVPGQTLAALIRQGRLGPAEKLRLVADACTGLAYAHRAGIIHLDVKPENLVRHDSGVLKILDFGIARVLARDSTHTRHVMGTLRYMAPEQATGQTIDLRSDVFALGCVLYEVIAGVPAFKGTMQELLSRVTKPLQVSPLSELVPGVHPELVRMTQRAMAADPDERYNDLEVLKRELDGLRRRLFPCRRRTTRFVPPSRAVDGAEYSGQTRRRHASWRRIDRAGRSKSWRPGPIQWLCCRSGLHAGVATWHGPPSSLDWLPQAQACSGSSVRTRRALSLTPACPARHRRPHRRQRARRRQASWNQFPALECDSRGRVESRRHFRSRWTGVAAHRSA